MNIMIHKKKAVILFNLGGPDKESAIKPFLFNLFSDKAIIPIFQPVRFILAKLIAAKREDEAKNIYKNIGGKSPILELTIEQASALEKALERKKTNENKEYKVFVSMRYWHPFSQETAKRVKEYDPDELFLIPLYPQFSTTTTKSSFDDWQKAAKKTGIKAESKLICCYYSNNSFIKAHTELLRKNYLNVRKTHKEAEIQLLFSAHGLPKRIIKKGDPYVWQIEQSTKLIMEKLALRDEKTQWSVCYQSKVGGAEWIKPYTEDEIVKACRENKVIIIVPIAFVSEHSETIVELDIKFKQLAKKNGAIGYYRLPALGTAEDFIKALAEIVINSGLKGSICSHANTRECKKNLLLCAATC